MADLTTGRLAMLRDRLAWDTEPHCLSTADFAALLDMAERCAKAEAERDSLRLQVLNYERAVERAERKGGRLWP